MKDKLISRDEIKALSPFFRGKHGEKRIDFVMKYTGLNLANEIYDQSKRLHGRAFSVDMLNKLGIIRQVKHAEILEKYKDRPFITVSNHPYGHIDGISLIETVTQYSSHFKVLVNIILSHIDTMKENFICVNPDNLVNNKKSTNWSGLKECIQQLKQGYPLGIFPAGAVSNLHFNLRRGFYLEDKEWKHSIIKLIQKMNVPVIPIHISGHNSFWFYANAMKIAGMKIRDIKMTYEMVNKKGKKVNLTVGAPIMPEEIASYTDITQLGNMLKKATYALAKLP